MMDVDDAANGYAQDCQRGNSLFVKRSVRLWRRTDYKSKRAFP